MNLGYPVPIVLRLVHPQFRDAVGEATTKLRVDFEAAAAVATRPPTPARWPRLETLRVWSFNLAALEALGAETWAGLRTLKLGVLNWPTALDAHSTRALAAALRRMPVLRTLELVLVEVSDASAEALFSASSAKAMPQLRSLTVSLARLSTAAARAVAATGWRLEALDLGYNRGLGAEGLAALLAAPAFAVRRLGLVACGLDAGAPAAIADAPWPLEELDLTDNDLGGAAAGRALVALSRLKRLRRLSVNECNLSAAAFKALVEAAWPALASLDACVARVEFAGPHALGAAAFAGFPALEELNLQEVKLGEAGARLLASRRWARLRKLLLENTRLGDAGLAALARGAWPALNRLDVSGNDLGAPPTLAAARRWAPVLTQLQVEEDY